MSDTTITFNGNKLTTDIEISKVPILSVNYILVPKDISDNTTVDAQTTVNAQTAVGNKTMEEIVETVMIDASNATVTNGKLSISTFLEKFYLLPYEINIDGGKLRNPTKIPKDTEVVVIDGNTMDMNLNNLKPVLFHGGNNQQQLEGGYYSKHSNKPKGRKFANTKHTKKNHKRSYYKK
jgi:hypothetical protein